MPRLTKPMKDEFIKRVINTLPEFKPFDGEAHVAAIREEIERGMPDDIKVFGRKYPALLERRRTVSAGWVSDAELSDDALAALGMSIRVRMSSTIYYCGDAQGVNPDTPAVTALLKALSEAKQEWVAQANERYALIARLREVVGACQTDAALEAALPEFKHLIPAPQQKAAPLALAQTSQLVADLIRAGATVVGEGSQAQEAGAACAGA